MEELLWKLAKVAVVGIGTALLGYGTYIVVKGIINKKKIVAAMLKEEIKRAIIRTVDRSENVVKLEDLTSDKVLELRGDDIDSEIREGDVIYDWEG